MEPFAAPPFSRCVTAATEVVMIGGGGRRTGAGARRLSIEIDRNTLRGLDEFEAVVSNDTRDADIGVLGTRLSGVTASCVVANAAEYSTTAVDDAVDGDVTDSSCPLSDVISFCAVVETSGMEVAEFDTWLLDVASCDVLCAVVVKVEGCGCVVDEANDVTGFCAVVDAGICADDTVVAIVEFRPVVETCAMEAAAFDTSLLDVASCDVLCVVVVKRVEGCGCVVYEANDVTGFCAIVDAGICADDTVVAVIEFRPVVETCATDVAAFDNWLLDVVACSDVIICAVLVMPIGRVVGL